MVLDTEKDPAHLRSRVEQENKKIASIFSKIINEGQVKEDEKKSSKSTASSNRRGL